MGRLRAASLPLAALVVCLSLVACGSNGGGELLPGTTADQINSNLDLVRESNAAGNCEEAETAVAEVNEEIDALQKVDSKLKAALEEGATKLSEAVNSCGAGLEAEEQKEADERAEEEEQGQIEDEEAQEEEQKALEKQQKDEEREEQASEKEEAEEEAEQPGPGGEAEGPGPEGKGKGPEDQEEVEPPGEEVTPPAEEGGAGGIGPGAAVEGGP